MLGEGLGAMSGKDLVAMLGTMLGQGNLTEREGSVQLTYLYYLV